MRKKFLSNRITAAVAFLAISGGLLFLNWRDGNAVEKTKKGWLGVSVQELTPSRRDALKLGNRTGLLITGVVENSPADEANLKEDDVLLAFDGKAVEKADDFTRLVRNTPPDKKVKVKVFRDGEERELEVTIGARPRDEVSRSFNWSRPRPNIKVWSNRPQLGVQVQNLNKDLAPYFKVEEKSGVLVVEVSKNTPAEKAGLKAGDVITRIGDEKITDADDLVQALRDYEAGDKVSIEYVRQGKSATAQAELEEDGSHGFQFFTPDRHRIVIPERSKIRIQRFNDGEGGELEILMPDIERHLDGIEKIFIERDMQNQLRKELQRLPEKLNVNDFRTI
ncbi:MAG: PDZ domain-containing protein [candidate division KSB1 bacterium]|nr:PDZ domain-containing protein [candidate division KSB1 bacterium]MDZ7364440.1 PDZ domain-containing protein [candidate division KSB1 bacterium]MDZ7402812.1 PDZ domain-containing protein [candidate division KSB1 bacterium]